MDANVQALLSSLGSNAGLTAVNQLFDRVEISTKLTPTVSFSLSPNGPPPDPITQQILDTLQPTVTLTGQAGTVHLAPGGQTQGAASWWPLALVGVGTIAFLGWAVFGD